MTLQIILNDASEGGIANGSGDLLAALDAGVFFVVDEFGETTSAESMVAGLDGYGDAHYFITEATGYLVFYRF